MRIARCMRRVLLATRLLVAAPMLMLSGITAPMEAMPVWVRYLMALSPLRYYIEIANGILLKGAGLNILWDAVLAMAALGAALFGSACGGSGGNSGKEGEKSPERSTCDDAQEDRLRSRLVRHSLYDADFLDGFGELLHGRVRTRSCRHSGVIGEICNSYLRGCDPICLDPRLV